MNTVAMVAAAFAVVLSPLAAAAVLVRGLRWARGRIEDRRSRSGRPGSERGGGTHRHH